LFKPLVLANPLSFVEQLPWRLQQPFGVTALQQPQLKPAALSLSATISQYFIDGMMPESANPLQQSTTVIEIRPYRGGWH